MQRLRCRMEFPLRLNSLPGLAGIVSLTIGLLHTLVGEKKEEGQKGQGVTYLNGR